MASTQPRNSNGPYWCDLGPLTRYSPKSVNRSEAPMRTNTVKQKMLRGETSIGAEAGLGSILSAEMLSRVGFDYVVVDMQHGAWTEESVHNAFRAIALGSALPMARVRRNDFGLIGRLLDIGAMGVIAPMVNSVEDSEALAHTARYPPLGGRSNGNFGTGFLGDDYEEQANDEIFMAVQIESAPAVEHAEGILAVEGIDGCWIGPGDLSASMRTTPGTDEHTAAIRSVIAACRKTGKIPGISLGSIELVKFWISEGCQFVTCGDDGSWMTAGAQAAYEALSG